MDLTLKVKTHNIAVITNRSQQKHCEHIQEKYY